MADFLELARENPVVAVILAGEVAFWILVVAGLSARYLLRWRRVGIVLLLGTPLVDVVILVATWLDLQRGGEAGFSHGLGAVYLGFSVAFGHSMIRWADERFAYRFAGGPAPTRPPKYGRARVVREWREWGKFVVAWAITCGIVLMFVVRFGEQADHMLQWAMRMSMAGVIWFAVGPLWVTLSPPKDPTAEQERVLETSR